MVVSAVNYNVIARFQTQLRIWPYFVTLKDSGNCFQDRNGENIVTNLPLAFKSFTKFSFPDILVLVVASHHCFNFGSGKPFSYHVHAQSAQRCGLEITYHERFTTDP